jgi:hypothetical protein
VGVTIAARLAAIGRELRKGIAGGCAVCRDWQPWRGGAGDPWAAFDGRCPVCARTPEVVCAPTEAAAAPLLAQCRPGAKAYIGLSLGDL